MNRTDQAPEPTMEEILASIRLIISDDAKKGPSEITDPSRRPAPPRLEVAPPLSALPEEDVLDLTEELVSPETKHASLPMTNSTSSEHSDAEEETPFEMQAQDAMETAPLPAHATEGMQADNPQPGLAEERVEPSRAAPPPSRTMWSRRELPGSPAATRYEPPQATQPQRAWVQDIQMPIPDQGPVSLIPGQAHAQTSEPKQAEQNLDEGESDAPSQKALGGKEEAAVAALAQSLARSAAGGMDSEELAKAAGIDFERIDDQQKAEVTETFANAIEKGTGHRDKSPLPTLLDEVFRQDFFRDSGASSKLSEEAEADVAPEKGHAGPIAEERPAQKWGRPEIGTESIGRWQAPAPQARSAPLARAETLQEKPVMQPQVGHAGEAPASEAGARSLEDAVRDMLKPLLVQWLNENMPRILDNAIRDEVAARGLSPKPEK